MVRWAGLTVLETYTQKRRFIGFTLCTEVMFDRSLNRIKRKWEIEDFKDMSKIFVQLDSHILERKKGKKAPVPGIDLSATNDASSVSLPTSCLITGEANNREVLLKLHFAPNLKSNERLINQLMRNLCTLTCSISSCRCRWNDGWRIGS